MTARKVRSALISVMVIGAMIGAITNIAQTPQTIIALKLKAEALTTFLTPFGLQFLQFVSSKFMTAKAIAEAALAKTAIVGFVASNPILITAVLACAAIALVRLSIFAMRQRGQKQEAQSQAKELRTRNNTLSQEKRELEGREAQAQSALRSKIEELDSVKQEQKGAESKMKKFDEDSILLRAEMIELRKELVKAQDLLEEQRKEKRSLSAEIKRLQHDNRELQAQRDAMQRALNAELRKDFVALNEERPSSIIAYAPRSSLSFLGTQAGLFPQIARHSTSKPFSTEKGGGL